MNTYKTYQTLVALVASLSLCGTAEDLVTDRPDATESSSVVSPGFVQVEAGWLTTDTDEGTVHELPQTLFRIGLVDNLELRLGWGGYLEAEETTSASSDAEIGAKLYLREEEGSLPEAALLIGLSLPWGDNAISSGESDPGFRFSFAHTLSDHVSLGYNLGVEWGTEDDATLASFIYTTALGIGLTEQLGLYVELYGETGLNAEGVSHSFDGGITYLAAENLQFDVMAGTGLSDDADDWFAGAGVSVRFPN